MRKGISILFVICPILLMSQESISSKGQFFVDSIKIGRINAKLSKNFTREDINKTKLALKWLDSIIGTHIFRDGIKSLSYKNSILRNKNNRECLSTKTKKRYSSVEIYNLIANGNDGLGDENDGIIDLYLDLDGELKGVVLGGTTCGIIKSGRNFFESNKPEVYAAHLIHEYMHVLGFNHRWFNKPFFRSLILQRNDPPYQVGKFVRGLIKK
jgi:hypothetical protein